MHTSRILNATDFQYWHEDGLAGKSMDFATFCPHYHATDRIGVVSPQLEDGIFHASYAVLSLATQFYDECRRQAESFFNYPNHFAFLAVSKEGISVQHQRLQLELNEMGSAWAGLDIWPDSNWIQTPDDVTGMLKKVFDWQISRLFWPYSLTASPNTDQLPLHVWRLLRTRLQTVYYYQSPTPTHAIRGTQIVETLRQRSADRLPVEAQATAPTRQRDSTAEGMYPYMECYQQVSVDTFLTDMASCFPDDAEGQVAALQSARVPSSASNQ